MSRYYFSGIDRIGFLDLIAREGGAGMVNATLATEPRMLAAYDRWPDVPLALDSGAFQGNTDVAGYAAICKQVGPRFDWVANLDVIGDQSASDANWYQLRELCDIDPLWVYQVRGGEGLAYLADRAETLRFVGIGGLVPCLKADLPGTVRLIESIGGVLARAWASAHFFGGATPEVWARFAREPWFASADSQAWLCGFKAQELILRDGRRAKAARLGLELTCEECAAQNVRQFHGWLSGKPLQLSML